MGIVYLSKNKIRQLKSELKRLEQEVFDHHEAEHDNILMSFKEAASFDTDIRVREKKLKELKSILRKAKPLNRSNRDTIEVGSKIMLLNMQTKRKLIVQLVDPLEVNIFEKKFSYKSDLGRKLIGKKKGESIQVNGQRLRINNLC